MKLHENTESCRVCMYKLILDFNTKNGALLTTSIYTSHLILLLNIFIILFISLSVTLQEVTLERSIWVWAVQTERERLSWLSLGTRLITAWRKLSPRWPEAGVLSTSTCRWYNSCCTSTCRWYHICFTSTCRLYNSIQRLL